MSGSMQTLGLTIVYGAAELFVAIGVGATSDYVFAKLDGEGIKTDADLVRVGVEVAAQVILNSIASAALVALLIRAGDTSTDPTGGTAFALGLFFSQPALQQKVVAMTSYISSRVHDISDGVSAPLTVSPGRGQPRTAA